MRTFGLIGYPLTHSFSKQYFTDKFKNEGIDAQYLNFELEDIINFPTILQNQDVEGFNVTIPHKEDIFQYLHEVDEEAQKIGAVNTIKVIEGQWEPRLIGYNTDAFGFQQMLKPFLKSHHQTALILGTGGASKAVKYVLDKYGIHTRFVSRNPSSENDLSWKHINKQVIDQHQLIVNTTPLGMYPNLEDHPNLPYFAMGDQHLLVDLIYNPEETAFMRHGRSNGATALNGLTMLHQQAEKAWEIWNG